MCPHSLSQGSSGKKMLSTLHPVLKLYHGKILPSQGGLSPQDHCPQHPGCSHQARQMQALFLQKSSSLPKKRPKSWRGSRGTVLLLSVTDTGT